jgi:hypothetical protein
LIVADESEVKCGPKFGIVTLTKQQKVSEYWQKGVLYKLLVNPEIIHVNTCVYVCPIFMKKVLLESK